MPDPAQPTPPATVQDLGWCEESWGRIKEDFFLTAATLGLGGVGSLGEAAFTTGAGRFAYKAYLEAPDVANGARFAGQQAGTP